MTNLEKLNKTFELTGKSFDESLEELELEMSDYHDLKLKVENLTIIEPVGYLEMIYLLKNCSLVMSDSGGLQKEAFFFHKPCITLRDETEWVELVENGFNVVVGSNSDEIYTVYKKMIKKNPNYNIDFYGRGKASKKIIRELLKMY